MSFFIFMDTKHHLHNLVVVRLTICRILSLHELGYWTWKAQITSIFIHEFMGHHDLFFQARYFDQIIVSLHDVGILEQSTLSFMCLLHPIPRHHFKDDTCPMHMLFHKFMVHLMPHRVDAITAYELVDLGV